MKRQYYNLAIDGGNFEPLEDGAMMVNNVIAMAAGEWTSMQGVTAKFSDDVLKICAENWPSRGVWTRHPGGSPRNIVEQVGNVMNPRYEEGKGVVVDIHLHGRSGNSKDIISMVQFPAERGGIRDVSAETILELDASGNVRNITFTGLAIVDVGACETCKIPAFAAGNGGKEMAEGEDASASGGEVKDTIVSIVRDIFREYGYPEIADLLDLAVSLDGDEKAVTEIIGKLKDKVKKEEPPADAEAPIAEQLGPFMKKMDEVLAFAKRMDEKNASFERTIGEVKATVTAFGNTALPRSKGADYSHGEEPVIYEENRPKIIRRS